MRGRVWVASYFFTSCPGQCLRLNANLQVLNADPKLKDVTWVSISCDPDTDTLEALRVYADRFQADPKRWLFCRADLDYVKLRLRQELVTAAFGADAGQRVLLESDPQALRAINVLPDAKRLAESVRNGTPVSFNFKTIRSFRLPSFPSMEEPDEILI